MLGNAGAKKKELSKPIISIIAIFIVAAIAGLVWLALSLLLPPTGEITVEDTGSFHVVTEDGREAKFVQETVYKNNGGEIVEEQKLLPSDYKAEVDFSILNDDFHIAFDGKTEANQTFEVYAETSGYKDCISKPNFVVPEEKGNYLVKLTATWKKGENQQIDEYVFGITVE